MIIFWTCRKASLEKESYDLFFRCTETFIICPGITAETAVVTNWFEQVKNVPRNVEVGTMISMAVLDVLDESKGSKSSVLHEGTELPLGEEAHERLLEEKGFWRRAESMQADDEPWEELRDQHVENGDCDQVGFSHPDRAAYGGIGHLCACDPTGTTLVSREAVTTDEEEEETEEERNEDRDYIRCLEAVALFAQDQAAGLISRKTKFALDHLRGVEDNGAERRAKRSRGLAQRQSESRR